MKIVVTPKIFRPALQPSQPGGKYTSADGQEGVY
jgi:hypothetical protein